jgi:hypothetical protein
MTVDTKPPRPTALPVNVSRIPLALKELPQWVVWQYAWIAERQQWTKPPSQANGREAKSNTPSTWTTFENALACYQRGMWDGIGIVVCQEQGLVGIDLDHCRDVDSGDIDAVALAIVREINSYTEVSPSGHGLRIFAYGTLPPQGRKRGGIEMYNEGRYLTVTGAHLEDTPPTIEHRDEAIQALHARVFRKESNPPAATMGQVSTTLLSDDEILSRGLAAKNARKLAGLWAGDLTGYASHSEADLSLCSLLAFWTQDRAQLDRLFRRSGLFREKWDQARGDSTYGADTLTRALTRTDVWRGLARPRGGAGTDEGVATHGVVGIEDLVDERVFWVASTEEKALVQAAGYRCCLAIPGIPPMTSDYRQHLGYLEGLGKHLSSAKQHIFLFPNTMDGRALTDELARRLGPEFVRVPVWPSECDTLTHIHTVYGPEVVQEVIEHTKPLPLEDVIEFDSLRPRLHDLYRAGKRPNGLSPGWPRLAEIYRIRPGQITLVLGQPGTGKSTFMANLAVNLMRLHGWALTIFSPEQAPPEDYATTLLQQWTSAPFYDGPTPRMELTELDQAIDALQDHLTLLWPDEKAPTIDYLLTLAKKEVFRRGIQGLVIDPWSEVEHDMQRFPREDLYIAAMLTKIRKFARTYKVHVWIVVHPPTLDFETDPESGVKRSPVPTLPSGGQKWRDKVDNLLALWREVGHGERDHILWIHTLKIRFAGYDGYPSRKAQLYFHQTTGTFSDVAR